MDGSKDGAPASRRLDRRRPGGEDAAWPAAETAALRSPDVSFAVVRRLPAILAILVVLAAYGFFASGGTYSFRRIGWEDSLYASLGEGFFRGQLSMVHQPDAALMAMPFPYDYKAREGKVGYIWDASYFDGRYYLYFSPLPVVSFYMPHRLLRGAYPRDNLAAAVFGAWAFLAAVAFARKALALRGRALHVPWPVWILLIGLANVTCYLLVEIRIYEVSILFGAALTATWAWALARYVEKPTIGRAVWMSVWLALSIAARPNLGVLLFVAAAVLWLNAKARLRTFALAGIPLAITFIALVAYNVARFGQPFEFGTTYQLTFVPMQGLRVCSLCTLGELSRFGNSLMHYLFWAPTIRADFPFVNMQFATPDPKTSFAMPGSEQVVGVFPLVPLAMLGTLFAVLLALLRRRADAGTRVGMQMMAAAWLVLLGISTCWWIVSRYSIDFMFLMAAATVVCVESGLAFLATTGIRMLPLRIAAIALAVYSIIYGFLLGFAGPAEGFKRLHPELFEKLAKMLSLTQ